MKKIITAAALAAACVGMAGAANLTITGYYGQSLATFNRTDDDDDDDDGIRFFDHYMDNQMWGRYNNVSVSGESAIGGASLELKYNNDGRNLAQTTMNGWLNINDFLGTGRLVTFKFGRFDALPAVDFVEDATRGFHYNSYAAQYQAGFDPQVMSWFLRTEGFRRSTIDHTDLYSSYSGWQTAVGGATLSSYNWFFNDSNNAASAIGYESNFYGQYKSLMTQLNVDENLFVRFVLKHGSASDSASSISHDFYGQRTFTNWNAQVSYAIPDVAKLGLTVKMTDMLSGSYKSGSDLYKSAGTDLNVALAASTDALLDGLRLYAGYTFAGVYLGMEGKYQESDDVYKTADESYFFHAIDLRGVYDVTEQLSVGLNGNVSIVQQSEYAKNYGDGVSKFEDDVIGFNVGVSASYALSDILAIDLTAGFRCLDVNNKIAAVRDGSSTKVLGDKDPLAVSCVGIEPSVVFTFSQNAALSIGVNVLLQNLSANDALADVWQNNRMDSGSNGQVYPYTTVVTLPLFMYVRL